MSKTHTEIWKPVAGYEGVYEISNMGRVKRVAPTNKGAKPGDLLKPFRRNHYNYLAVNLWKNARAKTTSVHRLVLEAFVGPCPPGMVACHNNGNPADNRLENLRWDTQAGNMQDAIRHGTLPKGSRHGGATLTEADILRAFKMRARGATLQQIADTLGISVGAVSAILRRKQWRHVEIDPALLAAANNLSGTPRGARHGRARLSRADVLEIYRLHKAGYRRSEIVRRLGLDLNPKSLADIVSGRTWKHLYRRYFEAAETGAD